MLGFDQQTEQREVESNKLQTLFSQFCALSLSLEFMTYSRS